jgi:hypothetical protein
VVLVVEIEDFLESNCRRDLEVFLLVAEDVFGGSASAALFVVAGADFVAGVTFGDQLCAEPGGLQRYVVEVGVEGGVNLALVRLPRLEFIYDEFAEVGAGHGGGQGRGD